MSIENTAREPDVLTVNRLLSTRQIAEYLGYCTKTVLRYATRKTDPLPSIKFGKDRKYKLDQVIWWTDKFAE